MSDTLVLNCSYMPIDRVSWQRAFSLVFAGRAAVVEEYEDWTVSSTSQAFKVPSIIRFLGKASHFFKRGIKFSRQNVYVRDKGRCQYCGARVSRDDFTYDHVVPRKDGGKTVWDNIVVCCLPCNQQKSSKSLQAAGMRLLALPVRPKSLPGAPAYVMSWTDGMPLNWREYLGSINYWTTKLDE